MPTVEPELPSPDPLLLKQWTVSALILHPNRRILLLHHRKLGVWLYPGGHVEPTETPDQALQREVFEETGLRIRMLGECDSQLADVKADVSVLASPYVVLCERIQDRQEPHYHLDLVYLCQVQGELPPVLATNSESGGARFVGAHDFEQLPLFDNFRSLLRRVFADESAWARLKPDSAPSQGGR